MTTPKTAKRSNLNLANALATTHTSEFVRSAAVRAVAKGWDKDPDTLPWLRQRATTDKSKSVRFHCGAGSSGLRTGGC